MRLSHSDKTEISHKKILAGDKPKVKENNLKVRGVFTLGKPEGESPRHKSPVHG